MKRGKVAGIESGMEAWKKAVKETGKGEES
jgi:hypothetical protein